MEALRKAIDLLGGQAPLAKLLGFRHQSTVSNWLMRGRLPEEHCAAIEAATGGQVRCEDLRPDLRWQRDPATGAVLGYFVNVTASATPDPQQEAA